jgi:hypothetical protein
VVPSIGPMPKNAKHERISLIDKEQAYEVVFANCNNAGRTVFITGQAYDENEIELSFAPVMLLTTIAPSICLLFTFLTVRIRRGTGTEFIEYHRLNTIEH